MRARCFRSLLFFVAVLHGGVCLGQAAVKADQEHARPVPAATLQADQAALARVQRLMLQANSEETDTTVPAAVQAEMPLLKNDLTQVADDVFASLQPTATSSTAEQALKSALPSGKGPSPEQLIRDENATRSGLAQERGLYGGNLQVRVRSVTTDVLLVDLSFEIECGEDNILLGYSNTSGHWEKILRWQAKPYTEVSGAFGDIFEWLLLNGKRNSFPVLLVVHGTPWCTSTESGFAMDTFELQPGKMVVTPFWHASHGYRRADDVPPLAFVLKKTNDGFEVKASVDDRIGPGINRVGIMRYGLVDGLIRRELPIGMNSRESVSEWLDMPRAEAAQFTDAPPGSETWKMWEALTYRGKDLAQAEDTPSLTYGDVRAYTAPKHYQVGINAEFNPSKTQEPKSRQTYYVVLQEVRNGYRVERTLRQPDAACQGRIIPMKSTGYASQSSDAP